MSIPILLTVIIYKQDPAGSGTGIREQVIMHPMFHFIMSVNEECVLNSKIICIYNYNYDCNTYSKCQVNCG